MGLNWSAGATAVGEGLELLMRAKEKNIDVELENIRQANYARLRKELAQDDRDWVDTKDAESRKQALEDREEGRVYKEGQDEIQHTRDMEVIKASRSETESDKAGKISLSSAFTPESMRVYTKHKRETGEYDPGLLVIREGVEPGMSRQEYINKIILSLRKPDSFGDVMPEEDANRFIKESMDMWDKYNTSSDITDNSGSEKSTTGSVFEPRFGGDKHGSQYGGGMMPGATGSTEADDESPFKIN